MGSLLALVLGLTVVWGEKQEPGICSTRVCAKAYRSVLEHGCRRLRGLYELKWADKFVTWLSESTKRPANFTRIVPLVSSLEFENANRYISIADIHGDFEALCQILVRSDVMNLDGQWIAGANTFVIQTGDIVDRGMQSSPSYQLLFDLQDQTCNAACNEIGGGGTPPANCAQSNVIMLFGNHEHMHLSQIVHETVEANWLMPSVERLRSMEKNTNYETDKLNQLISDFKAKEGIDPVAIKPNKTKYTDPAGTFSRVSLGQDFKSLLNAVSNGKRGKPAVDKVWDVKYGVLGNEIVRRLQTSLKIGRHVVYVHAGLEWSRFLAPYVTRAAKGGRTDSPSSAIVALINEDVQKAVEVNGGHEDRLFGNNGPLWTREVSSRAGQDQVCESLGKVLNALEVDALVVGHTPISPPFAGRCDRRQILMDVAMSYRMAGATPCWLTIANVAGAEIAWRARCLRRDGVVRSVLVRSGGVFDQLKSEL